MKSKSLGEFLAGQELLAGGLKEHIRVFGTALADRGYALSTTREQVRLVADLGRWLEHEQLAVEQLDEACAARFLAYRRRSGLCARSNSATIRILLEVLRESSVLREAPTAGDTDKDHIAQVEGEFARYLMEERGLCVSTRINYVPMLRRLLQRRFGSGPVKLEALRPGDITGFIVQEAGTVSPGRMKVVVPALRVFLRWLFLRGVTETNLAGCVPRVADWRLATLPKSIATEQVEHLLQCCDHSTAIGRRDYAVLLLLARFGLRSGEIVAMDLDDIDWEASELLVHGKGGRHDRLPLPRDVGAALAAYLQHGRPSCSTRRVFVRSRAPHRGFASPVAICNIVRRGLTRAGLEPPRKGAHLLRHALACTMLRRGASLREIGEVLRHRRPDTTTLYAKVDVAALRALAQAWPLPGGAA